MSKYDNPIPGSSREFNDDNIEKNIQILTSENENLNNCNVDVDEIVSNSTINIINCSEEIKSINFSQNQNIIENNDNVLKLLMRCNTFIDMVGRNIIYLEEMMSVIKSNINISIRNATKAHECIEFEKKSVSKISTLGFKNKAHLTNFFKLGLSNCPQNPHLTELYDTDRLILSYNGNFISEKCIETVAFCKLMNKNFKNKLEVAINLELLDKIKNPLIEQNARLSADRALQNDPTIKNKIELEMLGVQKQLNIVSKTPFKELLFQFMNSDSECDWLHVASLIDTPDFLCKRMWHLFFKPQLSRAKWTKNEEEKLIEIVNHYKGRNWQQIAIELDTNRNELQCFVHSRKFIKTFNKKGKWSKQEDQKLIEIIKENSYYNIINWQKVNYAMHNEGRSNDQIYNRWMWSLRPGIRKGFLDEREQLIVATAKKQNLPAATVSSKILINRTSAQIRYAYRRVLSNEKHTVRGPWTPEDDGLLLQAVFTDAPKKLTWGQVSEKVPGRNPESCRHRIKVIEKALRKNPNITIDDFPRSKQFVKQPLSISEHIESSDEYHLQKKLKKNRKLQTLSSNQIESDADRKLKRAFIDNVYVSNNCNFSSKCDLFKYILNHLNADLIVPQEFVHKNDLINEGLMSMMSYLKQFSNDVLTLQPNKVEETISGMKFIHENPHDVLTTSDIINSDLSEINGLLDIRMRNFEYQKSKSINIQNSKKKNSENSVSLRIKNIREIYPLPSVPPNFETFRCLQGFLNSVTSCEINENSKVSNTIFDWDNEESKKLHQRLVSIFGWPTLLSGMIKYDSTKINVIDNTEVAKNLNHLKSYSLKKKKPSF